MDRYDKKIFANNLNGYLQRNQKKQSDLVELLGVSKSTVSSWCSARKMPRIDMVERIARYFGIRKSDLIEEHPAQGQAFPPVNSDTVQLLAAFDRLPESQRTAILTMVESLLKEQGLLS